MGELSVLNVAGGDIKITFDRNNVAESIRARRMVGDMIRRGYALLVEVERNGERAYERALGFDETKGEYLIADFDPHVAEVEDAFEEVRNIREGQREQDKAAAAKQQGPATAAEGASTPPEPKLKRGGRRKSVPMDSAKAVGVARSAGG